jgi:hypothetical protein
MKIYLRFISIISILTLSIVACATLSEQGSENSAGVLFKDDFSDPSSGWDRVRNDEGITDYEDGAYRIYVQSPNIDYWANPNLNFTDVNISVQATKVGGSDDNDFGVLCRYQDPENFYFFIISSDGYYGIGKMLGDQQILISDDNLLPSEEINQGNARNTIQASCIGNMLSLSVNGKLLSSVEDKDFLSGDVGLITGTYDSSGTDVHFDDFRVLRP